MIKKVLLTSMIVLLISTASFSQRGQKIGYVDLEYILENIPEYAQAQAQLDQKVVKWQQKLDKLKAEIETMKIDLSNEKALLTDALIEERLEDIAIVEEEFKKTEMAYFSSDGDLFFYRKLLVKPIQDQVYNAVQEIGAARKYEIIFDKSSDLIMLYTSKKADISDLVLKSILRTEKTNARNEKVKEKNEADATSPTRELTEEEQKALDEREAKRAAAVKKSDDAKAARLKKREDQKAEIERKRLERLKQKEEAREELKKNKEENNKDKEEDDNNN
ncbi:MAG: OmpH family outer membrane protein [Urechidicola sp.]|nr:OmpH family outer membrane protein [Urechidicola sp.]